MLVVILIMLILTACTSVEPPPTLTEVPPTDTKALPTITPLPPTLTPLEYVNAEWGYSFERPVGCSFGPMGSNCKQSPPEERPPECLCFLDAEDPNQVTLQAFLGSSEEGLTMVTFSVTYHDTFAFNLPEGEDPASWLKDKWHLSEVPEPDYSLGDGLLAFRIYDPGSPRAYSTEDIYVLRGSKFIKINMADVDPEKHREFYENILSTFQFSE